MNHVTKRPTLQLATIFCLALLILAACGSNETDSAVDSSAPATAEPVITASDPEPVPTTPPMATPVPETEAGEPSGDQPDEEADSSSIEPMAGEAAESEPLAGEAAASEPAQAAAEPAAAEPALDPTAAPEAGASTSDSDSTGTGCELKAARFVTRGSANPDIEDPYVEATCTGDSIVVVSNAVPDYTYIGTSPGVPGGREFTFTIPANPVEAASVTDIPYIGAAGVTLGGIPIYGPTEGTGGDVDSLPGIISACGTHMGPTGFHAHKLLSSSETDCFFTPEVVAAAPQLVGYAFDGYPIYTGVDQYRSSWQLSDESLFASDTWAAHSYVEGSGDLDRCNGRTDADGNYAYYTTAGFPYVLGCFIGEVTISGAGGGGGAAGDRPERPEGEGGERPAPPEGEGAEGGPPPDDEQAAPGDRPAPPEGDGEGGERPARPEGAGAEGGERPARPERPEGGGAGEAP